MTVLDSTNRARVAAQAMREYVTGALLKADLVAAVAATDDWIEANTAAFVAALPAAYRNSSNATQKILLFAYVLWRRAGKLHADEDG
jgi:hypothetical protein